MAKNTPTGSAQRHGTTGAVAGVLGAAIGIWLAKKGLPVDGDTAGKLGAEVVTAAAATGAAVASGIGALWRKVVGE